MKQRTMIMTAAVLAGAVGTGRAWAEALHPQFVTSNATWVIHLDLDAAKSSTLARSLLEGDVGAEIMQGMSEVQQAIGINPLTDLHGITIFGETEAEDEALVLVSTTSAIDAPLAKIQMLVENYAAVQEGDRTIHSWKQDDEQVYAYARPGTGPDDRLVLFSGNLDELKKGMLHMERPVGAAPAPVLGRAQPQPGSIVFMVADTLPNFEHDDDAAAILKFARTITFDAGEAAGQLFVEGLVSTDTPGDASNVVQVAQGIMALGRMAVATDPDLRPFAKLLDACRISADGATLHASFRFDSRELAQIAAQLEAMDRMSDHDDDQDDDDDDDGVKVNIEKKRSE